MASAQSAGQAVVATTIYGIGSREMSLLFVFRFLRLFAVSLTLSRKGSRRSSPPQTQGNGSDGCESEGTTTTTRILTFAWFSTGLSLRILWLVR